MCIGPGVPGVAGAGTAILEDFETFVCDAHVADLDFWSQSYDIDDLQRKFSRVDVCAVYMICEKRNAE